jgi:hypothetical protein
MPYILAFAFFLICMIVERLKKRAPGRVLETVPNANAWQATSGELVFGEHWEAWADAIMLEAAEPWETQAEVAA